MTNEKGPWTRLIAIGMVLAAATALTNCGPDRLPLVGEGCTLSPARLAEAKQELIRERGMPCPAPCDTEYVLAELAKLPAYSRCGGSIALGNNAAVEPDPAGETVANSNAATATILFETSGSMNGYLAQQSGLKDHLLDLVARAQSPTSPIVDALALGYIGARVTDYQGDAMKFSATLQNGKLPTGSGATSDIAELVRLAFAKTSTDSAVVLVSDMVFSPGRGIDPDTYLKQQEILIRYQVEARLAEDPDFSVGLVGVNAPFKGTYYCANDAKVNVDGERPYYMLIAGPRRVVVPLVRTALDVTGGRSSTWFGTPAALAFAIQPAAAGGQFGSYRLPAKPTTPPSIEKVEGATAGQTRGQLELPIRVDMSGLVDPEASAAGLTSDKRFAFESLTHLPTPTAEGFTHELRVRRSGTQLRGATTISLPRSTDGAGFGESYLDQNLCDANAIAGKTYGLQQLVDGLSFAYRTFAQQPAATLTFGVN